MARHTQKHSWARWKGTLDDLQRVVRLAMTDVSKWSSETPEFDLRAQLKGDREFTSSDPAELQTLMTKEPREVKELHIRIGAFRNEAVELDVDRSEVMPAVTLRVDGRDESRVHGLAVRLKHELDRGRRWVPFYKRLGLVLIGAVGVGTLGGSQLGSDPESEPTVAVRIALWTLIACFALLAYLTPNLELLKPGERSRWQRFGAVLLVLVAIAGLAIGIYEVAAD